MNQHQPSTPIPSRRLIKIGSLSSSLSTNTLQALDYVASFTMKSAGIGTDDTKMNALLSLASCKFMHDIVSDAMKYSKMEDSSKTKKAEEKKCLKMEHLAPCLAEYGIRIVPQMEIKKNESN
ncbi:hypothetical protein CDAR_452051 [Caerostris darwini]|uniref:Uncharacterized protein n=1 Tax=Caerostris darwini TaxID=1538125 RepID=A0AAV4WL63_9ARAC|nr:hypothetical protein CDAR_452051 [Caerostris darwini]